MDSNFTLSLERSPPTLWHAIEAVRAETEHGLVFVRPHGPALRYSWSELATAASACATFFEHGGLEPGAVCAIIAADPYEFACAFLASLCFGAMPMAFGPPPVFHDAEAQAQRMLACLSHVGCRHAFFGSELIGTPLYQAICGASQIRPLQVGAPASFAARPQHVPAADDICLLQLSSGSTGDPRAIAVSHRNLIANVCAVHTALDTTIGRERGVSWLPLWHDMGLTSGIITPLLARSTQVLIAPQHFAASPRIWLETVHTYQATTTATSNFGLHLAMKRPPRTPNFHLRSLRTLLIGAEPINAAVVREFQQRFAPLGLDPSALRPAYGLAEATLAVCIAGPSADPKTIAIDRELHDRAAQVVEREPGDAIATEFASCGTVLPGHRIAILDCEGATLPEDRVGEIAVSGPSVTPGIFAADGVEAHARSGEFLRTGDLGFVRAGELYVTGRIKDLIIVAGRNVHPQLIEWCVERVQGLRRGSVVAFSVPGRETERLIVLAECETPRAAAGVAAEIHQSVARELGLSVSDARVVRAFSLPKTSSGKLQRGRAKALYLAGGLDSIGHRPPEA